MSRVPSGEKYASAFSPPLVSWRMLVQMALAGGLARRRDRCAEAPRDEEQQATAAAQHRGTDEVRIR